MWEKNKTFKQQTPSAKVNHFKSLCEWCLKSSKSKINVIRHNELIHINGHFRPDYQTFDGKIYFLINLSPAMQKTFQFCLAYFPPWQQMWEILFKNHEERINSNCLENVYSLFRNSFQLNLLQFISVCNNFFFLPSIKSNIFFLNVWLFVCSIAEGTVFGLSAHAKPIISIFFHLKPDWSKE